MQDAPLQLTHGVDHPGRIELAHPTSMMQNQIRRTKERDTRPHRPLLMSTLEANTPFADTAALILGYLSGEVPLANVVAAVRALPPDTSADFAFGMKGQDISAAMQSRVDELLRVLSESDLNDQGHR